MTERTKATTGEGPVLCGWVDDRPVYRVGYAPEPWSWTPWEYAEAGRFPKRWDDPQGRWRSLYVGESPLACYLEVLAFARPDVALLEDLAAVDEAPEDAEEHPTLSGGLLPSSWLADRRIGSARLSGWFAVPGDKETLPTLRRRFLGLALRLRLPDVDAGTLRLAQPRAFTQAVAAWLYEVDGPDGLPVGGVRFDSRHGDGIALWALFERRGDGDTSALLSDLEDEPLDAADPALREALRLHGLDWADA